MHPPRLSRLPLVLAALFAVACAATERSPPTAPEPAAIPAWLLDHMKSEVGRWEADNAAYRSDGEPYDIYGVVWSWGAGKTSLAGTLYGRAADGENVEFWNFRVYWHPGTREARIDQWGHGGSLLSGTLRPDGKEGDATVMEIEQTWYTTSGQTARTRHRTLHRDKAQSGVSYKWKDDRWVQDREYTWQRVSG